MAFCIFKTSAHQTPIYNRVSESECARVCGIYFYMCFVLVRVCVCASVRVWVRNVSVYVGFYSYVHVCMCAYVRVCMCAAVLCAL